MNIKQNYLECYDSNEREHMTKVINAIANDRLIYIRFNPDCSGASFYYRDPFANHGLPGTVISCFDAEQTSVILMGCCIEKKSFGL